MSDCADVDMVMIIHEWVRYSGLGNIISPTIIRELHDNLEIHQNDSIDDLYTEIENMRTSYNHKTGEQEWS